MTEEERQEAIEYLVERMDEVKIIHPNGGNDWLYSDGDPENILKQALEYKRMLEEEEE